MRGAISSARPQRPAAAPSTPSEIVYYIDFCGGQWEVHGCEPPSREGDVAIMGCTALEVVVQVCGGDRTDPLLLKQRPNRIRNIFATIASVVVVLGAMLVSGSTQAGASSPADQGVTSTTIRIGISVINFAALRAVGVTLNDGNYQDAVSALTANMNAHGGVDGRKVVPYFVEMNPAVSFIDQFIVLGAHRRRQGLHRPVPGLSGLLSADPRHARHRGSVTGHIAGERCC